MCVIYVGRGGTHTFSGAHKKGRSYLQPRGNQTDDSHQLLASHAREHVSGRPLTKLHHQHRVL